MIPEDLLKQLTELKDTFGIEDLKAGVAVLSRNSPELDSLTIVSNAGGHHLPQEYRRGEMFIASEGNLDHSSREVVLIQYTEILERLRLKLMERSWSKIYLVPTGHASLSLQIKLAVYRVTRIETIDLFYSSGSYFDLSFDIRRLPGMKA